MVALFWRSQGKSRSFKTPTPGFCKPIEFNIPLGVSAIRGASFPAHPLRETPFVVTAPSKAGSTNAEYSRPEAYVPEAVVTGFFICNPPRLTARETAITKSPHLHQKRGHQRKIVSYPAWFRLCTKGKRQCHMPYAFRERHTLEYRR